MGSNGFRSLIGVAVCATLFGCGADNIGDRNSPPKGGPKKGTGGAEGAGSGGTSSFGNSDGSVGEPPMMFMRDGGMHMVRDAGDPDAALSSDNACGVGMAMAKLTPVNMFVMFDRSNSMNDNDKWPNATAALTSFFQNPGADGLGVALRFFPHDSPAAGCSKDGCDAVACSQPLVNIGKLTKDAAPTDTQEDALVMAINNSAPGTSGGSGGGTPIYAALDGALQWATAYQAMHTDEKTVVIFVTDGEPNGCDQDFNNISMLASTALMNSGVTTYAIGLEGSNQDQMDQLAMAGGTNMGIYIGNSANAEEELLTALTAIRGETLSCDFPMPEATDDKMKIDPAKVNVTFTPSGGMAATLPQTKDDKSCGTTKGWHYDDAKSPKTIVLCPAACDLVRADPEPKLEILLGCETLCGGLDEDCGSGPPPDQVPPPIPD
jgi:hypothetical protein